MIVDAVLGVVPADALDEARVHNRGCGPRLCYFCVLKKTTSIFELIRTTSNEACSKPLDAFTNSSLRYLFRAVHVSLIRPFHWSFLSTIYCTRGDSALSLVLVKCVPNPTFTMALAMRLSFSLDWLYSALLPLACVL